MSKLNLDELERVTSLMTPGTLIAAPGRGTLNTDVAREYLEACAAPGYGKRALHVIYVPFESPDEPGVDHLTVAITGNGPTSAINSCALAALANNREALFARARRADKLEAERALVLPLVQRARDVLAPLPRVTSYMTSDDHVAHNVATFNAFSAVQDAAAVLGCPDLPTAGDAEGGDSP